MLQFGSGLVHKGVAPTNTTKVGIFATNRPEVWENNLRMLIFYCINFLENIQAKSSGEFASQAFYLDGEAYSTF